MKKIIYLLFALFTVTPSMATQKVTTSLILASTLVLSNTNAKRTLHKKNSLDLYDLDEKQVLDLILNNYLRKAKIKMHLPNELRGLIIHDFFIHEWTIHGLHKDTGTAYDPHGFDITGIHRKTKKHLDPRGFKQNGDYKNANLTKRKPTKYDPQGYNIDRWLKNGLHENGCTVDNNGFTQQVSHASIALYKANKSRDIQAVNLILNSPDIDVNVKDIYGNTPLIQCCRTGDKSLEIAKLLLGHPNVDVNLKDKYGNPPLIYCCWKGDQSLEIAKLLLGRNDINVNLKNDKYGNTPLIECCRTGDKSLKIAKLLLGYRNVDINLKNKEGFTCLDKIIQCLLNHDEYYKCVNLWNVLVIKRAVLDKCKKDYENLNPSTFTTSQRDHVKWIKSSPPINLAPFKK